MAFCWSLQPIRKRLTIKDKPREEHYTKPVLMPYQTLQKYIKSGMFYYKGLRERKQKMDSSMLVDIKKIITGLTGYMYNHQWKKIRVQSRKKNHKKYLMNICA